MDINIDFLKTKGAIKELLASIELELNTSTPQAKILIELTQEIIILIKKFYIIN